MTTAAKKPHHIVIGSGPTGLAAASALLDGRAQVTLVDIGADMSEATRARLGGIATVLPQEWSAADRAWLARGAKDAEEKIPLKALFGENFMYDRRAPSGPDFGQWPSVAAGGFSRVWGATLKRFSARDLAEWPIGEAQLRNHYNAVEQLLGGVGAPVSDQASALLQRWQTNSAALSRLQVTVTPSSLAVSPACHRCGMCLTGCPYGFIFSADTLVRHYQTHPDFSYRPGLTAQQIVETGSQVEVIAFDKDGGQQVLAADRIFVAAGPLATARLMLNSIGNAVDKLTLQDSQYFLLPFVTARPPAQEPFHTLSQIFLELEETSGAIHIQLYGRNNIYGEMIAKAFGPAAPLLRPLAGRLGRHFLVAQGYLPSSESGSADLSLEKNALRITPRRSNRTRPALRRVWRHLARAGRLAGLHALIPLGQETAIGRGYHSGGTMPMARAPGRWQSDLLGRVNALERVHVVDTSVWPQIPSGPVTLTAMANAHRIASEAIRLDAGT